MDKITTPGSYERTEPLTRPSREEAEDAVRTLLAWAGDDPRREGLIDTPKRVVKAYEECTRKKFACVYEKKDFKGMLQL